MIGEEYYFIFTLAFVWIIAATIRDLKVREVPNWINFSLIGFALAYRAFYSSFTGDWNFFIFGIMGFGLFFILANIFYYGRVFAGGDAKMLMGLGIVMPFDSYASLLFVSAFFIFALFAIGSFYSLFYSLLVVVKNRAKFRKEFYANLRKYILFFLIFAILLSSFSFFAYTFVFALLISILLFLLGFIYIYVKSLDVCMIRLVSPGNLTEGDWLEKSVKIGNRVIEKSVHGLSLDEINLIRKSGKRVYIKEGIPFIPAFLITFIVMVFFYSNGSLQNIWEFLLSSFF